MVTAWLMCSLHSFFEILEHLAEEFKEGVSHVTHLFLCQHPVIVFVGPLPNYLQLLLEFLVELTREIR